MCVNEFSDKTIAKRISLCSICISNTFNKFLDVRMDGLLNKLSPCHDLCRNLRLGFVTKASGLQSYGPREA